MVTELEAKEFRNLTRGQQKKFEAETTLEWNQLEDTAYLISSDVRVWKKMSSLGLIPYRQTPTCRWYKMPKRWISLRKTRKLNLSPEQREKMAERARKI